MKLSEVTNTVLSEVTYFWHILMKWSDSEACARGKRQNYEVKWSEASKSWSGVKLGEVPQLNFREVRPLRPGYIDSIFRRSGPSGEVDISAIFRRPNEQYSLLADSASIFGN